MFMNEGVKEEKEMEEGKKRKKGNETKDILDKPCNLILSRHPSVSPPASWPPRTIQLI